MSRSLLKSRSSLCTRCQKRLWLVPSTQRLSSSSSPSPPSAPTTFPAARPSIAPKPILNIKHIRQNPELYAQTCLQRNYPHQALHPQTIISLHQDWQSLQRQGRSLRERSNLLRKFLANPATSSGDETLGNLRDRSRDDILEEARQLKAKLAVIEEGEVTAQRKMEELALEIPNLTSDMTPIGDEPKLLGYVGDPPAPHASPSSSDKAEGGHATHNEARIWRSHVHIGTELGILDFAAAATASGYGWYYLVGAAAQLEQALIQYALAVVSRYGWMQVSPPTMVYSHIGAACGFQPRDHNGEQQVYTIHRPQEDVDRSVPEMCLTGTSEIALAGMKANTTIPSAQLPMKRVAVSRCYRAEAGGRGADTKGLYRVHEFTKVEMFAWTPPDKTDMAEEVFDEMLDIQTEILSSLNLHARILEMPTTDLGASASRKVDMEAWFPSRASPSSSPSDPSSFAPSAAEEGSGGWGEVSSASICTDYQTRRLVTRSKLPPGSTDAEGKNVSGKLGFPFTVNGTALAVPRILAALLENGWDEEKKTLHIPEVLRPWMNGTGVIEKQ